ncbi:hypothetical protein [Lunatibacter salilacus]|uniref:hypothetical protein n=1 Tax=Lunatibacter salilacus TaxID=2483804 RepID=UPI00131D045B|nr:hypothetical protein [Lunatibacter salilacus]
MILENPQESRKEWLKMIFAYHAKLNKRAGDMQFWTHEIEHEKIVPRWDDYFREIQSGLKNQLLSD